MNAPMTLSPMWAEPMARDWSCFPIPRGEKAAKVKWERWQAERPDPATVAGWSSRDSNMAIVTGAISGLLVLDLDSADAVAEAEALGLPDTIRAKTAKGQHVYFRHPGGTIKNRAGIKPGWDIRCDGGYVIAPGSLHPSGAEYSWHHPPGLFDLAPPPHWLLDLIAKPAKGKDAPPRADRLSKWAEAALDGVLADLRKAPEGKRNDTLNWAAFRLGQVAGAGLIDEADAIPHLAATARAIGLDAGEIEATINSGWQDGLAKPRGPEDRQTFACGTNGERIDPKTGEIIEAAPAPDDADPVDLWGAFDPPDMPQGLLPAVIEAWALANGDNMGCDPAGLAIAALVTCAAAIPDAIKLKVKQNSDNWDESARLWAALIGNPSTKKSPILSAATGPLCRLDVEKMRAWQQRVRAWEALPADEKKATPRPPQERLRIEDATVEAAQQVLEGSHWGVMLLQDELSGLFGAMDKYSGGKGAQADRAFWLRSFNGGEYALNRVARGASLIPNLSVSMLGGIQPEPLRKIAGDATDDGLLQRLFPIILRPATLGRDEAMPPVNEHYRDLIEALHQLKPPGIGGTGKLAFSEGAQAVRRDLEARHLDLQGLETINRKLAAHIGKYDGMFARLCVVWHCVEHVGRAMPAEVSEATARSVAEFLHRFLLAHAISFYAGCLGLSDDHDRLTAIAGHILAHKLERVTNRDIARGDRTMRGLKDYEVRPLLEQLEALGWLEREEAPRPSSPPHYRVNPAVHVKFQAKGRAEAQRRKEARETIAGLERP
jgi:hypothetical protein